MSDFALKFTDGIDVLSENSKNTGKADSKKNALKIVLFVLLFLLFAEIIIYLFVLPCLGQVKILWSGLNNYSEKEMNECISSVSSSNFIKFNSSDASYSVSSLAGIESVSVEKKFPDKVFINVKERVPVAMIFSNVNGRTVPIQIDKNGILFPLKSPLGDTNYGIPIISGIPIENVPEGMRLPSKFLPLIDEIAAIRSINKNYFVEISEIRVVPKEYGNYELVLYPAHRHVKVLAEGSLDEKILNYMMVTLDIMKEIEPDVSVVDLRYGSVSYRTSPVAPGA